MDWREHARITSTALKNWFVAQCYDSLCVAAMWLIGLLIIGVPLAPLWAVLAGMLQFIPNFGAMISVIGPAIAGALSEDSMRFFYVLMLFAVIMVVDGLFLQPYLMRRTAKVPFWASLVVPIVMGHYYSVLGCALGPSFAGGVLCLQAAGLACSTAQRKVEAPCYNLLCFHTFLSRLPGLRDRTRKSKSHSKLR